MFILTVRLLSCDMPKSIPSLTAIALALILTSCGSSRSNIGDTGSLEGIQAMSNPKYSLIQKKEKNRKSA